jgi:hypothetical protein
VRATFPRASRTTHNDVAGFLINIVGVVYAVLLAFVVVLVWQDFEHAQDLSQEELSAADALFDDAGAYDPASASRLRTALARYAADMVCDEWPAMQHGAAGKLASEDALRLSDGLTHLAPRGARTSVLYADSLAVMHVLLGDRDRRLMINARGLPSMIWWTLLAGGAVTVVFTYLLGSAEFDLQLVMTALLSALIGVMFVLIMELNYPYRGGVSVDASGWMSLGDRFAQRGVAVSTRGVYGYHHGALVCDGAGAAPRVSP